MFLQRVLCIDSGFVHLYSKAQPQTCRLALSIERSMVGALVVSAAEQQSIAVTYGSYESG